MNSEIQSAYVAAPGYINEMIEEIERRKYKVIFCRDRLVATDGPPFDAIWALNVWKNPVCIPFASIREGAGRLREMQRNWTLFSTHEHRRATLIQEALPKVSARPLCFGERAPSAPLGSWTLLSRDAILAAADCSSPFPHGEARFVEDKTGPPSRAYLKLWEAFTRLGVFPAPGELCLDLGSAPGGWTWVAAGCGARVFSVDKAPLAPQLARHPLVEHCRGSAFGLQPGDAGDVSWLFCDVACYPERLLRLVETWRTARACERMICTVKFAGATDFEVLERFAAIPGSRAFHLFFNKHEITWTYSRKEDPCM